MGKIYNYTEYRTRVFQILCEEYGEDIIREIEVTGNNNTKSKGISFRAGTNTASPIIYFEDNKKQYTECDVKKFVKTAEKLFKKIKRFTDKEVKECCSWKAMRGRIFPKVINYEKNKEMLTRTPHVRFLDLAVVFFYQTSELYPDLGEGAVTVHERMKQVWGVNEEKLMKHAMENLRDQECNLKNLGELLGMYGLDAKDGVETALHILAVYNGMYGAAAMLNRQFMEEACDTLGCSKIWIIPSSVHEVLLLPHGCSVETHDLHLMCVEVNQTLEQEDVLSNSIYVYDNETKQINISDLKGDE